MNNYLYLYSTDIIDEGKFEQYDFKEACYAQALLDKTMIYKGTSIINNVNCNVVIKPAETNFGVFDAMNRFKELDELIICSNMWQLGIDLMIKDNEPQTKARSEDFDEFPFDVKVKKIHLVGSHAGKALFEGGENIAESIKRIFGCPVIASSCIVRNTKKVPLNNIESIRGLEPYSGKWETY